MPYRIVMLGALLSCALAACAPGMEYTGPEVTVINAPTEARVEGLATELEQVLRDRGGARTYRFSFGPPVRFQETHRDMYGSRALLQAAFTSRTLGSDYALLVSAPTYARNVREIENWFGKTRIVDIRVRVRASIVDPVTAEEIAVFTSGTYHAKRVEPGEWPLTPLAEDPDLLNARANALRSIAPALVAELDALIAPLAAP